MFQKSKLILSSIFIMLVASTTYAGPITIDGAVVFSGANGLDVDPTNSTATSAAAFYPATWSSAFSSGIFEGRSSVNGDYGFTSAGDGFQFDAFNVDTTINSGGPFYNPSVVVDDRASAQVQLTFTLTQAEQFSITGGYNGSGTLGHDNLAGGILTGLVNLDTNTILYLERKSATGSDSLSYQIGDPNPTVLTGTNSGILGPGQYRFIWETSTSDLFFAGGSLAAAGSANVNFQVGSFASAPEPDALALITLSLLGLALRRRSSKKQTKKIG